MDVDADEVRVTDHERRLAERSELGADRLDVEAGAVDQEFGAVPPALLACGATAAAPRRATWRARGLDVAGLRWQPQRGLAGSPEHRRWRSGGLGVADRPREPFEDHRQAEAAGVDHVGVAEHLELIGGALDRRVGLGHHTIEDDPDVVGGGGGGRGGRGGVANDGEDGAFGRLHHRPIGDR